MKEKIEKAINHFLSLDPESKNRLAKLNHKVLQIDLEGIKKNFQLHFFEDKIQIKITDFLAPDAIIQGTPLLFLHLSMTYDRKKLLQEIQITGDTLLAQAVMELFDSMDIDWEEYLSHWTGDTAAYQIGQFSRKIKKIRKNFHKNLTQQINDYLHEEINLFPPKNELADFFTDIDILRLDADRLSAKIEYLIASIDKESSP